MNEFKAWSAGRMMLTPPKRLMGRALNFAVKHRPNLIRCVGNGHIIPHNNAAKNPLRLVTRPDKETIPDNA
jgi:hypothetical protein